MFQWISKLDMRPRQRRIYKPSKKKKRLVLEACDEQSKCRQLMVTLGDKAVINNKRTVPLRLSVSGHAISFRVSLSWFARIGTRKTFQETPSDAASTSEMDRVDARTIKIIPHEYWWSRHRVRLRETPTHQWDPYRTSQRVNMLNSRVRGQVSHCESVRAAQVKDNKKSEHEAPRTLRLFTRKGNFDSHVREMNRFGFLVISVSGLQRSRKTIRTENAKCLPIFSISPVSLSCSTALTHCPSSSSSHSTLSAI